MHRLLCRLRCFSGGEDGNITVLMALAFFGVFLAAGAAIDYARLVDTRTALISATDAAALQAATSRLAGEVQLTQLARRVLDRNYSEDEHGAITGFNLDATALKVTLTTTVRFRTAFMAAVGLEHIDLPVQSEVTKAGNNLEVSLVLDTTGSMRGTKIRALKEAAADFVNTVVWDDQHEFYSKVAVVPYAAGVNLGSRAAEARGTVSSGTCTTPGCARYRFRNMRGANAAFDVSTCVSERTGSEAYTDAPPASSPVGRNYASPNNPCLDSELQPLTSNKDDILAAIDDLSAAGSTAGQVGIAWGWYVLARDFGMWSGDSRPAAYGADKLVKIAIIMTDGAFNTAYCNGVIARNSGNGSGPPDDKINCSSANGDAASQAQTLCTEMKKKGIIVYTIGFDIEDDEDAQAVMTNCASSAHHAYLAASATELSDAFHEIGQKVSSIRISR